LAYNIHFLYSLCVSFLKVTIKGHLLVTAHLVGTVECLCGDDL